MGDVVLDALHLVINYILELKVFSQTNQLLKLVN